MTISPNTVVSLTYLLRLDSAQGEYVEEANEDQPLTFIYGAGQMLEDFEAAIAGKKAGDSYETAILAERAYGPHFPEALVDMPKSVFEGNEDLMIEGTFVPMNDAEGNQMNGLIREVTDEAVVIDFNHPMAGKNLHFVGTIISVREADAEELSHGHIHGEGGVIH